MDALTHWLATRAPHLHESFADPIHVEALAETEALLGRKLPADYVAFLRRHDGQRFIADDTPGGGSLAPIFHAFEILASSYAQNEWRSMRAWKNELARVESVGPVRPLWTHEAWFPFTMVHGSSAYHCIDLDPAPGGDVGQVIVVSGEDERRSVIASSFVAFVERLAAMLDSSVVAIGADGIELSEDTVGWLLGD